VDSSFLAIQLHYQTPAAMQVRPWNSRKGKTTMLSLPYLYMKKA